MKCAFPLKGLKILELGNLVAAPFAGKIFSEFGAEVIKVEEPKKGDPLRNWRVLHDDTSVWWYSQSRNKKSITVNMRSSEGQGIIKHLVQDIDVVLENFKPGTMEKWGLGYEELKNINPNIILTRISGYGQTGPYKDKPGFGSVAESIGGLRYITGYPDRPPVRVGIALGDMIAGLYAVIGTMFSLWSREKDNSPEGQEVDVALYESVFSLLEGTLPEYDLAGIERQRTGSVLPGVSPSNTYKCGDGEHIVIGGNGDKIFQRLMEAIGRLDIGKSPDYATNQLRSQNSEYIDSIIEEWTKKHTLKEVQEILDKASVPVGPIYGIKDIVQDEQYNDRNMFQSIKINDEEEIRIPGIVPKLSDTPGQTKWKGPKLGEHNEEVYKDLMNLSTEEIHHLQEKGVI